MFKMYETRWLSMISPSSVGGLPSTIRKEFEEQSWLLACSNVADKKIDSGNAASPEKARFYSGCQWWCLPRDFQVSNFLAILWLLYVLVIYGHIWLCQFVWWELQWKCLETSHAVPGSIHEVSETNPKVRDIQNYQPFFVQWEGTCQWRPSTDDRRA